MREPLTIQSYRGPYEVRFSDDFSAELRAELRPGDVLVVDRNVATFHTARIQPLLDEYPHFLVQPAETAKSYLEVAPLIERLIQMGFRKNHRLVAIGGGITQDITAFISSILYRGVKWIFVPTNLLSQADSCIGSKTSINFGDYKNQIGGFHPPALVLNDLSLLRTLPHDEIRSGMGEMLHYFLLDGRQSFERVRDCYAAAFTDKAVLADLVHRSLGIKKRMIEIDEFDTGPRNIFNYGHSFGHAIESYTNYAVPHGIAVSFGMDVANHVSVSLGLLSAEACGEMHEVLEWNYRETILPPVDLTRYLDILRKDKKNVDQEIRVILTRGLGDMFITSVPVDDAFRGVLASRFAVYSKDSIS